MSVGRYLQERGSLLKAKLWLLGKFRCSALYADDCSRGFEAWSNRAAALQCYLWNQLWHLARRRCCGRRSSLSGLDCSTLGFGILSCFSAGLKLLASSSYVPSSRDWLLLYSYRKRATFCFCSEWPMHSLTRWSVCYFDGHLEWEGRERHQVASMMLVTGSRMSFSFTLMRLASRLSSSSWSSPCYCFGLS